MLWLSPYPTSTRGRYCSASARCGAAMISAPARSAIVRASLRTRWKARAESCRRCAAARLPLARRQHPPPRLRRGFGFGLARQLLVLDAWDLDVDSNAVQQWAADALPVAD